MKKFVTIFPYAQNVHLIKDLGQVGNFLGQQNNFSSVLVCYPNSEEYSFLKTETKNLHIDFIVKNGKLLFLEKAVLNYLKINSKNIDVLNLYHLTKETIYYALYYLFLNKSGKVYLKMDVYNESLKKEITYSKRSIFQMIHKKAERMFLKKLSIISVENPTALELLVQRYPVLKHKAILVTNGVNDIFLNEHFSTIKNYNDKENIIVSVGRIGAKEKNYEMLLNSFSKANLLDWKLIFVGPIENDFDKKVEKIITQKPHLKDKIKLTGNIEDRNALYNYYNRSKICCLTSPFESFGIAFIESMYFGNYVIGTTGMSSFKFITNNFQLGKAIDVGREEDLVRLLEKIITEEEKLKGIYTLTQQLIKDKFYWSNIIKSLVDELNKKEL